MRQLKENCELKDHKTKARLIDNINLLMSKCRITLQELHKNTGVPIATIHRIRSDIHCNPTIETLKPLADFFAISISQLIGDEPLPLSGVYKVNQEKWTKLPILSWGTVCDWLQKNKVLDNFPMVSTDKNLSSDSFALKIEEDNLLGFPLNAIILVDPVKQPKDKDIVIAHKLNSNKPTIKRFIIYDGTLYLMPVNPQFKPSQLDDSYEILGVIVQIRLDMH